MDRFDACIQPPEGKGHLNPGFDRLLIECRLLVSTMRSPQNPCILKMQSSLARRRHLTAGRQLTWRTTENAPSPTVPALSLF